MTGTPGAHNVRIAWAPPDDPGDVIAAYTILLESSTAGRFVLACCSQATGDPARCVTNSAEVLATPASPACEIPLTRLQDSATFTGLSQGAPVISKVSATNAFGTGAESAVNLVGAVVEAAPHQPSAPARGSSTHES